ncbi:MAG: isoleucine--tRNA ligase, partial [Armatimonadetes bacterium]|nr:isoleucine--tRNA ligase [Armatimonadota bacterium]MDW8122166.1 isoleucine--tRNA ligase [Armatimonadota bacterium]
NKILKDIVVKYQALRGHYTPYVPGWDNHGLPIEQGVQEQLIQEGLWQPGQPMTDEVKRELRKRCRQFAQFWTDRQNQQFQRLGIFGHWDQPYKTMDYDFEARLVEIFGDIYIKGYIYRGFKTLHWCYHCTTVLAEAELEYHEKESPSVWVRFLVVDDPRSLLTRWEGPVYALIWTTTPWTIPGNTGIMVHPEFEYSQVKGPDGYYLVAEGLREQVCQEVFNESCPVVGSFVGHQLKGLVTRHPLYDRPSPVVLSEFVTLEQGSGLVHTAPGHGPEDYVVGVREGLPILSPIDAWGRFTDEAGPRLQGVHVHQGDQIVMDWLKEVGALLKSGRTRHSYPHCWRCRNPLIFRATTQWFMSMDHNGHRQKALEAIKEVRWVPPEGEARITAMVAQRPDWCLSRQRAWGVGIPVLYCDHCHQPVVTKETIQAIAGTIRKEGLEAWFEKTPSELLPKGFTCPDCGSSSFTKETDVLDVWFDSGCTHLAVLERRPELSWPADLYLEGSDQHRGWFNSSLMVSIAVKGTAPYRAVLTHGWVLDEQGRSMHKSLGNVVAPEAVIRQYGADVLRLWVCSSDYTQDVRLGPEIAKRVADAYFRIRNTLRFALGNLYDFDPQHHSVPYENLKDLDRLVLHRFALLLQQVRQAYDDFDLVKAFQLIQRFCAVDLSSLYYDIAKDPLYCSAPDDPRRRSFQTVLFEVAKGLCIILFPMTSFTSEEAWQHLPDWTDKPESVAFADWLEPHHFWINDRVEEQWSRLLMVRAEVHKALEQAKQERRVVNPLEAKVTLFAGPDLSALLTQFGGDLPEFLIVSSVSVVSVQEAPSDEQAIGAEEISDLWVRVDLADGDKCARCWQRQPTVGQDEEYPDLCQRCSQVVRYLAAQV